MAMQRGGDQFIPRPPNVTTGGPPPWASLSEAARQFSLAEVSIAVEQFAAPAVLQRTHPAHREAAVLLALFERGSEAHLLFIKRPLTMSTHQGQIAFPGGTRDPEDPDLQTTAQREAHEEVGLDPADVTLIGALDPIATIATPFVVAPFIGIIGQDPAFVPEPGEVDALLEVPLRELFADAAYREEHWEIPPGLELYGTPERNVYFYELPGETIWGATARIVTDFLARLAATRV
jgi:8-oxo-dGTP pyrophosphatase MutT (NUDIX family)